MAQICESAAPFLTKNSSIEKIRQSVTYHPSIWRDRFLAYTDDVTEVTAAEKEQHEKQMQKVKKLLDQTPDDSTLKIELIDAIQRLGIGYRFEKEIEESLRQIRDNYQILSSKDKDDDVRVFALRFRLLREQGYLVPCDVFNKLIDEKGNFKESLMNDMEGMLSVYEASNYGINGEEILDKTLEFFSSHLESLIPQMNNDSLSKRVTYALRWPIRKTLKRMGAKQFMSFYQEDASHNEMLLNFAKLDFNIVQKVHQREIHHITRWWEDLDFANKLPFARDRMVECYFWNLTIHFEPEYDVAGISLAKVIAMFTILDDIYDVYGSLDELRRFTDAIRRWDINAKDELPPYLGVFYEALLGVYAEMEDQLLKQGHQTYPARYATKELIKLAEAYMQEAEWCYGNYIPSMEEYMKLGAESSGYRPLAIGSLVGLMKHNNVTQQDFDWIANDPPIMRLLMALCRLIDDIIGLGTEQKITSVNCYMREKGCTATEALSDLSKKVKELWKDMNAELMAEPKVASAPIVDRIFNLTLALCIMYGDGYDAFSNSTTTTKNLIQSVLVDPAI